MKLHFRSYGSGHPLIILHGLLGSGGNWHTLSSRWFGEHFTVYAVDQRNHGRSPHSAEFDYEAIVDDLLEFMEDHGLASAHVLGHSMGGKTAMHLALSHPECVDRLVVADMATRAYPPSHDVIFDALRSIDPGKYGSRQEIDRTLAQKIPDAGTRQFLMKNLVHEAENGGYAWQFDLDAIYNGYDRLNEPVTSDKTFDKPALFVRGERSDYVRDKDVPGIKWLFPEAEIVTIPDAGHWVHADAPEAFAKAVLDFLMKPGRQNPPAG